MAELMQEMQQQLCSLGFAKSSKHSILAPFGAHLLPHNPPACPWPCSWKGSRQCWLMAAVQFGSMLHQLANKAIQGWYWIIYHSYYSPLLTFISLVFGFSPATTTLFLRREKNALYPIFKAIPSSNTNTSIFTVFSHPQILIICYRNQFKCYS